MPNVIILYDIPSKLPDKAWSPNVLKTRFTLTYKGIPFVSEWWDFEEIEPKSKELGIAPTGKKPDGSPHYTLPAIYDPATKKYISDSILIAEYLDKEHPNTPRLIPDGTLALQHAYPTAFSTQFNAAGPLIPDPLIKILNPSNEKHIRTKVEKGGTTVEEMGLKGDARKEQWAKAKANFSVVDGWIQKSGGTFLGGDKPIFADFATAGWIFFLRAILGKDSELWQEFLTWDDGRWGKYVSAVEQYLCYN
ncbi:hypothetical protein AX14_010318 [Amanita brunnescens Koide BX004]|nr:hypothetical protein AX14_010318 [Amanita brunnescens Koide BX004]